MSRTVGCRSSWSHPARLKTRWSKALHSDLLVPHRVSRKSIRPRRPWAPTRSPLRISGRVPRVFNFEQCESLGATKSKRIAHKPRGAGTLDQRVLRTARILDHISKRVNFLKDASPSASSSMLLRSWEAGGHSESGTVWGSLSFAVHHCAHSTTSARLMGELLASGEAQLELLKFGQLLQGALDPADILQGHKVLSCKLGLQQHSNMLCSKSLCAAQVWCH